MSQKKKHSGLVLCQNDHNADIFSKYIRELIIDSVSNLHFNRDNICCILKSKGVKTNCTSNLSRGNYM